MARANRQVANHVTRPIAVRAPYLAVVVHTGRRSGRRYRTPVMIFTAPEGYTVALVYGMASDWVRNVLAAGACDLEIHGRVERVSVGGVVHDETRSRVPWPIRQGLRVLDVTDFMILMK
jgi:deazaflavin-dependent oxidoreductase (nitroreductase family)